MMLLGQVGYEVEKNDTTTAGTSITHIYWVEQNEGWKKYCTQ